MAKIKRDLFGLSGKYGNNVFVDSVYGKYVRQSSKPANMGDEPALKKQYSRTALLNGLASQINRQFIALCKEFKYRRLYNKMLSRFRKEPLDNRFLLLRTLIGLEINLTYTLKKLGISSTPVNSSGEHILVTLKIQQHPQAIRAKRDCYFCEMILFTWSDEDDQPLYSIQTSDWINFHDQPADFDFTFPIPEGTIHWMLCLRKNLGLEHVASTHYASIGMAVIDAGSLEESDYEILADREAKEAAKEKSRSNKVIVQEVLRVKAKPRTD